MPTGSDYTVFQTGLILGVGIVSTLDEVILHQLLQWHNFYVHTHSFGRTLSDGLFHLWGSGLLVLGAYRLWRDRDNLRRAGARIIGAGVLLGMGGFNLWDGVVHHKLLRIHPVREGVANILPYDLGFIGIALLLLGLGWALLSGHRQTLRAQ